MKHVLIIISKSLPGKTGRIINSQKLNTALYFLSNFIISTTILSIKWILIRDYEFSFH